MLRHFSSSAATVTAVGVAARSISGKAPVLHLPQTEPKTSKDAQIKRNTNIAVEMIKQFKGPAPAPYTRKTKQSFDEVRSEIEALVGGAEKMRRKVSDDQPMDKLSLMERVLRHGMWSYLKEEGKLDYAEMKKWVAYTAHDETKLAQFKREAELKEKYAAFKKKRAETTGGNVSLPAVDWAQEYKNTADREIVAEKRLRYDTLAVNTTERNEAEVEALLESYRRPAQNQRLDELVETLEKFKPVLAREAIMQRLTIKHLEGQLGVWRYMDWCPEVRDRCELETDNYCHQWWSQFEEKILSTWRLRSPTEAREFLEKKQTKAIAAAEALRPSKAAAGQGKSQENAAREKLLREVIALQQRVRSQ